MLTGPRPPLDDVDLALTKAAAKRALFGASIDRPRVGRFEIVERIGLGGMGRVFRAYDPQLERDVALKLILSGVEADELATDLADEERRANQQRLLREARALASLSHPNVVAVYEAGISEASDRTPGEVFVAMELVEGQNLRRWLDTKPETSAILRVLGEAAAGLLAAHRAGIVHRDFKPENLLVGQDGRSRVADFGLARRQLEAAVTQALPTAGATQRQEPSIGAEALTETGARLGTPAYLAPEVLRGDAADARSDQYAFCVTAHEALFGHRPREAPPKDPPRHRLAAKFRRAIERGLNSDPGERHEDMSIFVRLLQSESTSLRWGPWFGLVLAVATGFGAWWMVTTRRSPNVEDPCTRLRTEFEANWPGARRARVAANYGEAQPPFRRDIADAVLPALDAHAAAWIQRRVEVCRASKERAEQTEPVRGLRAACLEAQRAEFDTTVDRLIDADDEGLERGAAMVSGLRSTASCDDDETLRRRVESLDADARGVLAEGQIELARARAEHRAGRYDEAMTRARLALASAERIGDGTLRGRALLALGAAQGELRQPEAEATLRDSIWSAEAAGDDPIAAQGWLRLTGLIGDDNADPKGAADELERASAAVERTRDPQLRARLARLRARLEIRGGDPKQALEILTAAQDDYARAFGPGSVERAWVEETMGNAHFRLGAYDQAAEHFSRAVDMRRAVFGRAHPSVGGLLGSLGTARVAQGRNEDAIAVLEEAMQITKAATPTNDRPLGLGHLCNSLGAAHDQLGHDEAALEHYRCALDIHTDKDGADHPNTASARNNIARVLGRLGRYDEAREELERVLEIRIARQGADHPAVAEPLTSLASLAFAQGDATRAIELHTQALNLRRSQLGDQHVLTAISAHNLGEAYELAGQMRPALSHGRAAVSAFAANASVDPSYLALARFALARYTLATGRRAEARGLLEAAIPHLPTSDVETQARAHLALARATADPAKRTAAMTSAAELLADRCPDAELPACAELERLPPVP